MGFDGLLWIVTANKPGMKMVYWAFSPQEVISIIDELAQDCPSIFFDIELTTNPSTDGVY